jgi:hypothetical protein
MGALLKAGHSGLIILGVSCCVSNNNNKQNKNVCVVNRKESKT